MKCSKGPKLERKVVEKNRRMHMKSLFFKLDSLVPKCNSSTKPAQPVRYHCKVPCAQGKPAGRISPSSKFAQSYSCINAGEGTQQDRLDEAVTYIKDLKEIIERLKKKERTSTGTDQASTSGSKLPVVEVRHLYSSVEVVLVTSGLTNNWFLLPEVIRILGEEGAEVVSASFSTAGDRTFYTIHSQAICARIGVDTESVSERLAKLLHQ